MNNNTENKRTLWIHIRLTPAESEKINTWYRKTTCRDLSSYARKVLLNKPVTVLNRNASFDHFIRETILLRNELNAIGSNLNQMAKKINSYATEPGNTLITQSFLMTKNKVEIKISEIKDHLNTIAAQWLQE